MIKEYLSKIVMNWRVLLKDRTYVISLLVGALVIIGAYFFSYFVSVYHESLAASYISVGDFILDSIPTYNLAFLDIWGFIMVLTAIFAYVVFYRPEKAPFAMKTFGILIIVRACFITLTNVGPPQGALLLEDIFVGTETFKKLFFENDLFFSGHTAIPFLAFLIFKDSKIFKWLMLAASVLMAVTVLLMHVHYSIDVFAAVFIAHGVYSLSNKIFNDLNVRFKKRIELYGWGSLQRRIGNLKDRYRGRKPVGGRVPVVPEVEKVD
ncbi:MAG: phosphatase PAP2-related protein [Candidatus Peregrinibacteria bacterium]